MNNILYQFNLPQYQPILAVFVEQRLSQRMQLPSIKRSEPQKFLGVVYLDGRQSNVELVLAQHEENCHFKFTYFDPNMLEMLENFKKEITEIWKGYCDGTTIIK